MSTTFSVKRNGNVDLVFDGVCLVDLTSRTTDDQEYWTEIRIYHTTTDKWVAEMVGRSALGEKSRINVTVLDDPYGLRDALKRKPAGEEPYLTSFSLAALKKAATVDPAVNAALGERI